MLCSIESIHEVDSLEQDLLVFDVDFSTHFEKPIDDGSAKIATDLDLISQQSIEL